MTDEVMEDNVKDLELAVVGHKIVKAEKQKRKRWEWSDYTDEVLVITLDNGKAVTLANTDDCCAYTDLDNFLLNVENIDHIITGVKATDDFYTWHVFCDMGDVLQLDVSWSEGSGYYGYGFYIDVQDVQN